MADVLLGGGENARQGARVGVSVRDEGGGDGTVGEDGIDVFLWNAGDRGVSYKVLKSFGAETMRSGREAE